MQDYSENSGFGDLPSEAIDWQIKAWESNFCYIIWGGIPQVTTSISRHGRACPMCAKVKRVQNFGETSFLSPAEIGPKYARGENRVYTRFYCRFLIRTIGPFKLWNMLNGRRSYSCLVETHPPPSWRKYNNMLYILYFHVWGILCQTI